MLTFMWTLFEVVTNLFQAFLMLHFLKKRLHLKKHLLLGELTCVCVTAVLMSVNSLTASFSSFSIPDTLFFLIPFVYLLFVVEDRWYVSLFWTSVLMLIFFLTVSLSLHIFTTSLNVSYDEMMQKTSWRILFVFVTNCALAALLYAVSKFKKDYSAPYWPVLLLFLGTNAALCIAEESVYKLQISVYKLQMAAEFQLQENVPSLLGVYGGLTICLVLNILLYHLMSQSLERENRYQAEAAVIAQSKQYQEELSRIYTNLCHARHDMKQHYQLLQELVESGGNERAVAYLEECRADFEQEDLYWTGSTAVDALILAKSLTMKKQGILFRYSPYPLKQMPIKEAAFCTILGNLLDNAIEGVLRLPPSEQPYTIQLTFSRSWDMFYIFCSNPCNEATIVRENDHWRSSKTAEGIPGFHSIGIRSIERLTNSAEGRCSFDVSEGKFIAKVVLPCTPMETEDKCK